MLSVMTQFKCSYCLIFVLLISCHGKDKVPSSNEKQLFTTFSDDIAFLKHHTEILILEEPNGPGRLAIAPALQARVMTSSSSGMDGRSFGWINRELFTSGDTLDHINPYGGEERFWLGPEGGQYAIFFENGSPFNLESWQTPRLIDLDPFHAASVTTSKASFYREASLRNYSGFIFGLRIERTIEILSGEEVGQLLDIPLNENVQVIGYRTPKYHSLPLVGPHTEEVSK